LIWDQLAKAVGVSIPVFTLVICTLGGLIVGVLVKVFGDHSGIFAEMMLEFGKTGRFNLVLHTKCDHGQDTQTLL
jgi:hypothetical protein